MDRSERQERDADEIFLQTLEHLEREVVGPSSRFGMLMVAHHLRQLLLDGDKSITLQVNQSRRQKIRFQIRRPPLPKGVRVVWVLDGIDPANAPGDAPLVEVSLDRLLKAKIGSLRGVEITVWQLVHYFANVAGGVHLGMPNSKEDKTLAELDGRLAHGQTALGKATGGIDPSIRIDVTDGSGDLSGPLRSLRAVGRVVLRGLAPLADQVRAGPPSATDGE